MTDHERTIDVRGHVYTLVAFRTGGDAGWTARVGRYAATGSAARFERPVLDARSHMHDVAAVAGTTAVGPTAEAALDRLAADLRASVEGVTMNDPEAMDSRRRERAEAGATDDAGGGLPEGPANADALGPASNPETRRDPIEPDATDDPDDGS